MLTTAAMTAEEFFRLPEEEPQRRDLMEGEVWTMAAAGAEHGLVAINVGLLVGNHVRAGHLGAVFGAETGFTLARNPDTVLAPDLAFVRADRIPPTGVPEDFWEMAPDLVVKIFSPTDRPGKLAKKVATYLRTGVRLVWVIYPRKRIVVVHEPGAESRTLTGSQTLDGGAVLPGFSCRVGDLWPWVQTA